MSVLSTIRTAAEKTGRGLHGTARTVDSLLRKTTGPCLDWLYDEGKRRAMRNPVYAEIDNRRHDDNHHGSAIFLSEEAGLGWEEWDIQQNMEDETLPHPWWKSTAQYLHNYPLTGLVNRVRWAYQRVTRGWDDTATWSLDTHVARTLGEQLQHLADTIHGWPDGPDYPTFEDWQNTLRVNSAKLLTYETQKWDPITVSDENGNLDPEAGYAEEERLYRDAQEALVWVSENFGSLWD